MTVARLKRYLPFILLSLVCILAAVLRLSYLGATAVHGDQSFLLRIAANFAAGGRLPLAANQAAPGITQPPFIEYLLALPLFVRHTVMTAVWGQALFSFLAIPLLYGFGAAAFNERVGLLAAFWLAVNPWAVHAAHQIGLAQSTPLLAVLVLGHALLFLNQNRSSWRLPFTFLWLAALTQLNFRLPVLLLAALLASVLIGVQVRRGRRQQQDWTAVLKPALWGLGLFLLAYLPYLLYERSAGYANLKALWASWGYETSTTSLRAGRLLLDLAGGASLFRSRAAWETAVRPWFFLGTVAQLLLLAGLGVALWRSLHQLSRARWRSLTAMEAQLLLLALWLLLPLLLHIRRRETLAPADFLFLLPAAALLTAVFLDWLAGMIYPQYRQPWLHWGALALLAVLFLGPGLWQALGYWAGLQRVAAGELTWGRPAAELETAVTQTRAALADYPGCGLIILGPGDHADSSPWGLIEPFVQRTTVRPTAVRFVEQGRGFIQPSQCTVYLLTGPDAVADAWLTEHGTMIPIANDANRRFFYVPSQPAPSYDAAQANWRNGLMLLQAELEGTAVPGANLSLQYTWHILQKPLPGSKIQFFNHVVNENGEIVAQEDGGGVHTLYWQPGDTLVNRFYLTLPTDLPGGVYTVRTGAYTWPDLQRLHLRHSQETTYDVTTFAIP